MFNDENLNEKNCDRNDLDEREVDENEIGNADLSDDEGDGNDQDADEAGFTLHPLDEGDWPQSYVIDDRTDFDKYYSEHRKAIDKYADTLKVSPKTILSWLKLGIAELQPAISVPDGDKTGMLSHTPARKVEGILLIYATGDLYHRLEGLYQDARDAGRALREQPHPSPRSASTWRFDGKGRLTKR